MTTHSNFLQSWTLAVSSELVAEVLTCKWRSMKKIKIYCIFYIFKNIHTVASWNGVSSSPFFKTNSMIILYMDLLSLHIVNLDNWDTISQCLQHRTSRAEAADAQKEQVDAIPSFRLPWACRLAEPNPSLASAAGPGIQRWVGTLRGFHPEQFCFTSRNNCRKTSPGISSHSWAKQELLCILTSK